MGENEYITPAEKQETLIYGRKMGHNTKIVNMTQWQEEFYDFEGVYCDKYPNESSNEIWAMMWKVH